MSGFDKLAPYYERMAKAVWGKSIAKSRMQGLDEIPSGGKVLVLAGGTGSELNRWMEALRPEVLTFTDLSSGMLEEAKKQLKQEYQEKVKWMQIDLTDEFPAGQYDLIICQYFLDLFGDKKRMELLAEIRDSLKDEGILWLADFRKTGRGGRKGMQERMLVWMMYGFFRMLCRIEGRALPDWEKELEEAGIEMIRKKYFSGGVIFSALCRKRFD